MNNVVPVNIDRLTSLEVERLCAEKLRALLSEVFMDSKVDVSDSSAREQGIDFIAKLKVPNGPKLEFLVECKAQPRPSLIPEVPGGIRAANVPAVSIDRRFNPDRSLQSVRSWVYAAPFVSPRLAEVCWERGWGWFDLAGNCRIAVPGLFYMDRKGNQPVHQTSRAEGNLGSPEAAQVVRALLKTEHSGVRWSGPTSQRALKDLTEPGVSLGLVNKIVAHLRNEGHLAEQADGSLRVTDPEKLLLAWRNAYRFDRIPQKEWFTLLKNADIEKAMREINAGNETRVAWAAFSAAERQAPMVRQPKFWLMAMEDHVDWIREMLKASAVDSGANLTLLIPPDRGYLAGAKEEDHAGVCTHPLQTYVDTWHAGGRGQEAADAVLDRRLRPAWSRITAL
ncbi:MAG TPA: hypothetical protein VK717_07125 [Opitutaceae bacterium]|nr:hypothetical protein [Opitutaceae bacterium]